MREPCSEGVDEDEEACSAPMMPIDDFDAKAAAKRSPSKSAATEID